MEVINPCYEEVNVEQPVRKGAPNKINTRRIEANAETPQTDIHVVPSRLKNCLIVTAVLLTLSLLVLSVASVSALGGYFWLEITNLQTKLQQQGVTDNQIGNNSMYQTTQLEIRIAKLEYLLKQTTQQSQEQLDKLEENQQKLNDSLEYYVDNLGYSVNHLEYQLNQTKQWSQEQYDILEETQQALNDSLKCSVEILEHQLNQTKQQSQEQFDKLEESQQALKDSLEYSIKSLEHKFNQTTQQGQGQLEKLEEIQEEYRWNTTSDLNDLQSSMNDLTTKVNSPVNLYQNCTQETSSCTTHTASSQYWKSCVTPVLPIDNAGYYTLGMRCKYNPAPGWLDTTALRQSGSFVECFCVTVSGISSTAHIALTFSAYTCTLVITRCPISQTVL